MSKRKRGIPPALKHGIYSGLGLLPTESRAKFRKFKKERFAELALTGPSEEDIGEEIVALECTATTLACNCVATRGAEIR
jgi:hypothetical protein